MEQFDYIKFVNDNPLLKETDGYGSYKNPKTMLEFEDQDDFYINVSVRDAKKALEILRDEFSNEIRNKIIQLDGSDSYVINDREVAMDLYDALKLQGIEVIDTDVEVEDSDFDGEDGEEEMFEYVSDEDFDTMSDDELDAAEEAGDLNPSNQPLGPDEELMEANVPENIKNFAKRKGISSLVNKVANWAEKAGTRIKGGTAIGKNYGTLILDLKYQGGEIRIDTDDESVTLYDEPVFDAKSFLQVYKSNNEETMNEDKFPMASFEDGLHNLISKAKQAGIPKRDIENIVRWALSDYED